MESENGRMIGSEYEDTNWQYISGGRKIAYLEETVILQRMKEATNSCVVLSANYCLRISNDRQGTIDSRNFFTLALAYQITRYPSNNLQLQSLRIWFLRVT